MDFFRWIDCVDLVLLQSIQVGSHANERHEPGQAGNGAAINVSLLCRGKTRLELVVPL